MSLVAARVKVVESNNYNKAPRDKFILGESGCNFSPEYSLTGRLDPAKVSRLFAHENTSIEETEPSSTATNRGLKVLFDTGHQVKLMGFINHGDSKTDLVDANIEHLVKYIKQGPIVKAITVDELLELF